MLTLIAEGQTPDNIKPLTGLGAGVKEILAARIIEILDEEGLSVRKAQRQTGIAAADFSRIRNGDLGRFSVDRLVRLINKLDQETEVSLQLVPRDPDSDAALHP